MSLKRVALVAVIAGFAGFPSAAQTLSVAGDWRLLDRSGLSETFIDATSLSPPGKVRIATFIHKSPAEAMISTYTVDCSQKIYQTDVDWLLKNGGTHAENLGGGYPQAIKPSTQPYLRKMMDAVCRGKLPQGPGAISILATYRDWKSRVG